MSFVTRFKHIWNETVLPLRPVRDRKEDGSTDRALDAIFSAIEAVGKPPAVHGSILVGSVTASAIAAVAALFTLPAMLILGSTNAFARHLDNGNSDLEKDFGAGALLIPTAAAVIALSPFIATGYLIHAAQVAAEAAGFGNVSRPQPSTNTEEDSGTGVVPISLKASKLGASYAPAFNSKAGVPAFVTAGTPAAPANGGKLTL